MLGEKKREVLKGKGEEGVRGANFRGRVEQRARARQDQGPGRRGRAASS